MQGSGTQNSRSTNLGAQSSPREVDITGAPWSNQTTQHSATTYVQSTLSLPGYTAHVVRTSLPRGSSHSSLRQQQQAYEQRQGYTHAYTRASTQSQSTQALRGKLGAKVAQVARMQSAMSLDAGLSRLQFPSKKKGSRLGRMLRPRTHASLAASSGHTPSLRLPPPDAAHHGSRLASMALDSDHDSSSLSTRYVLRTDQRLRGLSAVDAANPGALPIFGGGCWVCSPGQIAACHDKFLTEHSNLADHTRLSLITLDSACRGATARRGRTVCAPRGCVPPRHSTRNHI